MKKRFLLMVLCTIMISSIASAACSLDLKLLNQDPYPAVPGENVKVVLQLNGTADPNCGEVFLDVVPEYPFSIDSSSTRIVIPSGTYISGYESFILKGYKLRVDGNALDGDNKLKAAYGYSGNAGKASYTKEFDVNVKDSRTDFDISIQDYDATKNVITFGIINIGKRDVESLTLEIPDQENIKVNGANKAIIGSLNSHDDTTASIESVPNEGEIRVRLSYNDQVDVRRTVEKEVTFSKAFLDSSKNVVPAKSGYYYLFWVLVAVIIIYFVYRYFANKRAKNNKLLMKNR